LHGRGRANDIGGRIVMQATETPASIVIDTAGARIVGSDVV
jgi:hypothetical protein